jgi:hypothetical protein
VSAAAESGPAAMSARPDPDVESFLLLLAARRSPRTVDAYVVEPGAGQIEKILHVIGGDFREKFEGDGTVAGGQDGLCHVGKR